MDIDASELEVVGNDISNLGTQAHGKALQIVAKTAADVSNTAKLMAPVDTGNLMNSIGYDLYGTSAEIGPTAEYGMFLEYGTSRMPPQPYMKPALDAREGGFLEALSRLGDL